MTVQEFVNIDKDLQTVQDISDVNIIILIPTTRADITVPNMANNKIDPMFWKKLP
jgi:hypothetical protein